MIDFMKLQNGNEICGVAAEGVPGEEINLTEETAGAIAGAFAYWLGFKVGKNPYDLRIAVGNDPRLSADILKSGILKGIAMFGAEGYDAGLASTPAMFMSTVMPQLDFDGAVMITAGHLPWNRNGFRLFTKEGPLEEEDIASILKTASRYNFVGEFYEERETNVLQMYAAYMRQMISLGLKDVPGGLSGMHIVVDAGCGTGGFFAKQILEPMGADISGSRSLEPDGIFPGREPDPESEIAMASLCKAVADNNADLGILFDADAGRAAFAGPGGRPVAGDKIIALAAALAAEDYPGGTVVTDSITSDELHDFLESRLGLKHLRYKKGYRNVINKAAEINSALDEDAKDKAFLAIETTGHAAYSDNFFLDDGAFLAVQIIINAARLRSEGKDITALIEGLRSPAESHELRVSLESEDHRNLGSRILEDVEKWVKETSGLELVTPNYEGVRVNFRVPDEKGGEAKGWFLLKDSLHDPVMELNIESDTEGTCAKVIEKLYDFMGQYEGVMLRS